MKKNLYVTNAALIAALYVVLGALSSLFGLDSGVVQLRLSEALCVLPAIYSPATLGVTVGCLIFNTLFTSNIADIVFGTLATLIGAFFARLLKKHKYLSFIPTVISNTIIIPLVLSFTVMDGSLASFPVFALSVAIGEIVSCGIIGSLLLKTLEKRKLL